MRRRTGSSTITSRPRVLVFVAVLFVFTYYNYKWALSDGAALSLSSPIAVKSGKLSKGKSSMGLAVEETGKPTAAPKLPPPTLMPAQVPARANPIDGGGSPTDAQSVPPESLPYNISYREALDLYEENQGKEIQEDVKQPTKAFVDVPEHPDHGVLLPHDPTLASPEEEWQACDQRNAEFTVERDQICQRYLSNLNNMKSIKALSSILKRGRTIKYKIFYHHNNIEAIVKVSQMKFVFEPVSEYLAFAVDRELNFTRTPTAAYVGLPLDYMKAASAIISPFYCQWFRYFIMDYDFTKRYFVPCAAGETEKQCSLVTIQLWMKDLHSALYTSLALPYEFDEHFAAKFYTPGAKKWPPKPLRLRALGDINIRFILDFLMGNTDRGMNDHNNFVYGGCDSTTRCAPEPPEDRTKGIAKYAFIDHGSSFYSRKEPEENPFTGNLTDMLICRYRRSTYNTFKTFQSHEHDKEKFPLIVLIKSKLPKHLFRVVSVSVFQQVQVRLDKVITVMENCVERYGEKEVFSLPEYWEV